MASIGLNPTSCILLPIQKHRKIDCFLQITESTIHDTFGIGFIVCIKYSGHNWLRCCWWLTNKEEECIIDLQWIKVELFNGVKSLSYNQTIGNTKTVHIVMYCIRLKVICFHLPTQQQEQVSPPEGVRTKLDKYWNWNGPQTNECFQFLWTRNHGS